MKSLYESIFDIGTNIHKDLTFGDVFTLDEHESVKSLHSFLGEEFSVQRLKRILKANNIKFKGEDNDEIIYNGVVELISNIKFDKVLEDIDKQWLMDKIAGFGWDLFRNQKHSSKTASMGVVVIGNGHLQLQRDISLFDDKVDTLHIYLGNNLKLIFKRK